MNEDIETLVLSGKLFGNQSRSSSPERTPSPDSGWHDEELNHRQGAPGNSDSDADGNDKTAAREEPSKESIGMGPGRTGVKGVIRDRNEALSRERDRQKRDIDELNAKLEKSTLGGKTYLDEEREKARIPGYEGKVDELIVKERELMQALKGGKGDKRDMFGRRKEGRFGHLREVGAEGFVDCIDEDRGVWVLVHLYDQSLERCDDLDDTLAQLARLHPDTKFIRARASTLGFTSSSHTSKGDNGRFLSSIDEIDEKSYDDGEAENDVDLDMLPTLLVYRDGDLVHNWVRVDWEAGRSSIRDLLERHRIVPPRGVAFPPDDDDADDDLQWNDL
ncbi:hypothetical protein AX14_002645 [Amanita brunnescens Koide BX004]|nr:hypothetical protein AX14_002645 [Amanita brunnescens Koide BX004]